MQNTERFSRVARWCIGNGEKEKEGEKEEEKEEEEEG